MNILVACEYSGRVRDAFIKRGHNAVSCDLLPSEMPGPHYQGNVMDILYDGWDMLIAHPPCTYLSYAGLGWFNEERHGEKARQRKILRTEAMYFFGKLLDAPIPRKCLENPRGWPMRFVRPTQMIEPWYFGDNERKKTYLWLVGLPPLIMLPHVKANPLIYKPKPDYVDSSGKNRYFTDRQGGIDKWKTRSRTFNGIAQAMAQQWG